MLTLDPQGQAWPGTEPILALPMQADHCALGQLTQTSAYTTSGAWTVANQAVIYKFFVYKPCTVYKIGWLNGSATGNATCVALYNFDTLARLVTTTATTRVTNSVMQWIDVADTALVPNQAYYAAMSHSTNTANNVTGLASGSVPIGQMLLAGVKFQASVGTLPDPLVPADPAATALFPLIFLAMNSGAA